MSGGIALPAPTGGRGEPASRRADPMGVRPTVLAGIAMVVLFFGGFGAWAALAPLESAAIAVGVVGVDSRSKTIQHLEGGIVAEILVDEGTEVAAGDPLLRLDETQTRATLERLVDQSDAATALQARLVAERDGAAAIAFPSALRAKADDPDVAQMLTGQQRIFEARRDSLANQRAILRQRIAQLEEEIAGLEAEIVTQDEQMQLIAEEESGVARLVEQGLERRPRLLALRREASQIEGLRAQNRGRIARARQGIAEAELQIEELGTQRLNEVVAELRDTETALNDLRERIGAAEDVLRRTVVVAPVAGTVVNLQLFTPGGVIGPGEALMDIVPSDDPFIIEARIDPNDIDAVHPGLPAQVRLSAFDQRQTPTVEGTVRQVSADRLVEERTGVAYYLARIALDEAAVARNELELRPGMPAEVMIVTGERTPLDYLLRPILTSFGRSLRDT